MSGVATAARRWLNGDLPWLVVLAVGTLVGLLFLAAHFAFVPMWIEGMAEHESWLLALLGYTNVLPPGWLHLGRLALPLTRFPATGALAVYLDVPATWLWFSGRASSPYVYRFAGIAELVAITWLLYGALRRVYPAAVASLGALAFFATPTVLLLTLTDRQTFLCMLLCVALAGWGAARYLTGGHVANLLLAAFGLGLAVNSRVEALIWPVVALAVYLPLARPPVIAERWHQTPRRRLTAACVLVSFLLGASPFLLANVLWPEAGILAFVRTVIFPRALDSTAMPIPARLVERLAQFWEFNLLNHWPFFELRTPNVGSLALWLLAVGYWLWRAVRTRRPDPWLVATTTTLPVSVLVTSVLRHEHLLLLQPVVLMTVVGALGELARVVRWRPLAYLALVALVSANVVTTALDWRLWTTLPDTSYTMLNQSEPAMLASYLRRHHARDLLLTTNIGLASYLQYITVSRLAVEQLALDSEASFTDAVRRTLGRRTRRRVFIAVGLERDGTEGTLPRTRLLFQVLDSAGIAYTVNRLASPRNQALYDIIVVEPGITSR